jgi:hypothetical protein
MFVRLMSGLSRQSNSAILRKIRRNLIGIVSFFFFVGCLMTSTGADVIVRRLKHEDARRIARMCEEINLANANFTL